MTKELTDKIKKYDYDICIECQKIEDIQCMRCCVYFPEYTLRLEAENYGEGT